MMFAWNSIHQIIYQWKTYRKHAATYPWRWKHVCHFFVFVPLAGHSTLMLCGLTNQDICWSHYVIVCGLVFGFTILMVIWVIWMRIAFKCKPKHWFQQLTFPLYCRHLLWHKPDHPLLTLPFLAFIKCHTPIAFAEGGLQGVDDALTDWLDEMKTTFDLY
jgi:hypothetical protein